MARSAHSPRKIPPASARKIRRRPERPRLALNPWFEWLEERVTPTVSAFTPSADNTLYQTTDNTNQLSDGVGQHFFVGETNAAKQKTNNLRRGLVQFDLSSIPKNSTINSVTLTLHLSKSTANPESVSLYDVSQEWGEGTSNAAGPNPNGGLTGPGEGDGAPATAGDATWYYSTYEPTTNPPPVAWTNHGGDFSQTVLATATVNIVNSDDSKNFYTWTGSQLNQQVTSWVNDSSTNFGVILIGNETLSQTVMQFDSRENTTPADRPQLSINYTPPVPLSITTTSLPPWSVGGRSYSQPLTATGGKGPYTFSVSQPSDGLSINSAGTSLVGLPLASGGFYIGLTVTDSLGAKASTTLPLHINAPPSLGVLGQTDWTSYQAVTTATIPITGGTTNFVNPPVVTGLPSGMSASVSGSTITISGDPESSTSSIQVTVTDQAGATATRTYAITVEPPSARTFYVDSALDAPSLGSHDPTYDSRGDISLRSAITCASEDATAAQSETDTIIITSADDYFLFSPLVISGSMNIEAAPGLLNSQVLILDESKQDLIDVTSGVVSISGVEISGALFTATGGIYNSFANLTLNDCLFSGNDAAAIANTGLLAVNDCTFTGNTVPSNYTGGAISNFSGTMTISGSTFASNFAGYGGAISSEFGSATILNSTFLSNNAAISGGAISNGLGTNGRSSMTIVGCTFSGNSSQNFGGAIDSNGTLDVVASTISGNSASISGDGIYTGLGYPLIATLYDDIVIGNFSNYSGQSDSDLAGGGGSLQAVSSNNLIGVDNTGVLRSGVNGNQVGVSSYPAGLSPLDYYGGPTQTILLQPGSPAIGRGGAVTTLAADFTDPASTSVKVGNGLVFAASSLPSLATGSYFSIRIDGESMAVTGLLLNPDGSASLTVVRGTNAAAHSQGSAVFLASDQAGFVLQPGQAPDIGALQTLSSLVVNTTTDDNTLVGPGQLSFRDAVDRANQVSATTTAPVSFDSDLFATTQTITLVDFLNVGALGARSHIELDAPVNGVIIAGTTLNGIVKAITVTPGTLATVTGKFTIDTPIEVQSAGRGEPASEFLVGAGAKFRMDQGSVDVQGIFTVDGRMDTSSLVRFLVNNGGLFNVDAGSPEVIINGVLVDSGQVVVQPGYTGPDGSNVYGGLLNAFGEFDVESGASLNDSGAVEAGVFQVFGNVYVASAFTDNGGNPQPGGYLVTYDTSTVFSGGMITDAGTVDVGYLNNDPAVVLNILGTFSILQPTIDSSGNPQPGGFLDDFGVVNVGPNGAHLGSIGVDGQLTVEAGAALNDGDLISLYSNGELDIFGTVTIVTDLVPILTSPNVLQVYQQGQVVVEPGTATGGTPGLLDDQSQLNIDNGGSLLDMGTVSVDNYGAVQEEGVFRVIGTSASLSVDSVSSFTVTSAGVLAVRNSGFVVNFGYLEVASDSSLEVQAGGEFTDAGSVFLDASGFLAVDSNEYGAGIFYVDANATLTLSAGGDAIIQGRFFATNLAEVNIYGEFEVAAGGFVADQGGFLVSGSQAQLTVDASDDTSSQGEFDVNGGTAAYLVLTGSSTATIDGFLQIGTMGNLNVSSGATLIDDSGVYVHGRMVVYYSFGSVAEGKLVVDTYDTFLVDYAGSVTIEGKFTNNGGSLTINGVLTVNSLTIGQSSVLYGEGTIIGPVFVGDGGYIAPGYSVGVLATGSLTLSSGATFDDGLVDANPGDYGQDSVTGTVSLGDATLNLFTYYGYTTALGDQYVLIANDGTDAVKGNFVAGYGIDAVPAGTPLLQGDVLSTNFNGSGRVARISYQAGPNHNSVAILLSPLTPTIDFHPRNPGQSTTAVFHFSDADTYAQFRTSLDNAPFVASDSPLVYPGLASGEHTFEVEAVDQAGNVSEPAVYSWNIITVAPGSVSWGSQSLPLVTASDGLRLLPSGRVNDLPWLNITGIAVHLSQDSPLNPADVTVTGINRASYGPVTITGSGSNYFIRFASPIAKADRITVTINNSQLALFTRRLDVLPGDFNDDSAVNTTDGVLLLQNTTPTHPYLVNYDLNGDGAVNTQDFNAYRPLIGTTLPLPPQLAAGGVGPGGSPPVSASELAPVLAAAIQEWAEAGLPAPLLERLRTVTVRIADLPVGYLAATELGSTTIELSADASGFGWYVDSASSRSTDDSPAANREDLLTVLAHELGHTLGLDDLDPTDSPSDLMAEMLATGVRRLPSNTDVTKAITDAGPAIGPKLFDHPSNSSSPVIPVDMSPAILLPNFSQVKTSANTGVRYPLAVTYGRIVPGSPRQLRGDEIQANSYSGISKWEPFAPKG